ncbi:PTS sugar transporter subunit IIA [Streptomyces sp. NPDC006514]|uniref:PTS sugar transporter subunit IIA n=1 Tax=Streptomyces sp. NPDC006514 TaxID=3154308 RepID=UPI0033BB8B07
MLTLDLTRHAVEAARQSTVLQSIAELAAPRLSVEPRVIVRALKAQEGESSTSPGDGWAVPHAHLSAGSGLVLVLLKLSTPVEWKALDETPVDLVVATLAGGDLKPDIFGEALTRVTQTLMEDELRATLREAGSDKELHERFPKAFTS